MQASQELKTFSGSLLLFVYFLRDAQFLCIRPMYFGLVVLEFCCVMCVYLCTLA
jgi:hypothetical protein